MRRGYLAVLEESRKRKLMLNTLTSILFQLVTIVVGFILPKLFLQYYGSEINGLISSITQFLGFIALMELGIGAVVQSVLYKPLVSNDTQMVSKVIKSAQSFFNKIAIFYFFYMIVLVIVFPSIEGSFDWSYSGTLIVIIAISSIAQYFFGLSNQLLLIADQKNYIVYSLSICTIILNTLISMVLIIKGFDIRIVKFVSMFVLLLKPLFLTIYVKNNYEIDKSIEYDEEPIKQKWNGIAQHVASFVLNNTDVVILTIFSNLKDVSIYTIYKLVVSGLQQVVLSVTAGVQSLFGHMLANEEYDDLRKRFIQLEWVVHTLVTILFSCTGVLIVPFIQVYTRGINDANYVQPYFGLILTFATGMYCLRLPYNIMVLAAGHYKETQLSAIIEMMLNILISTLLVYNYGLIGVSIGTLVAMAYRTIYLSYYLSNNIIYYKFRHFVKHFIVDLVGVILVLKISNLIIISHTDYLSWTISAIKIFILSLVVVGVLNLFFYKNQTSMAIKILKDKIV